MRDKDREREAGIDRIGFPDEMLCPFYAPVHVLK